MSKKKIPAENICPFNMGIYCKEKDHHCNGCGWNTSEEETKDGNDG